MRSEHLTTEILAQSSDLYDPHPHPHSQVSEKLICLIGKIKQMNYFKGDIE